MVMRCAAIRNWPSQIVLASNLQAIDTSKELVGLLISGIVLGSWTANKRKAA